MTTKTEPRIRPPTSLDDAQRKVFDAIVAGPRGDVPGPLGVWLWRPELADRAQRLGEYARYQTSLPPLLSELAILAVARFWGSEFEWHAHKRIALQEGISSDAIAAIRARETPVLDSEAQATVYDFSRTLLNRHEVDDGLYERAVEHLGVGGVIDLVGILGYYSLISLTINVFRVPLPDGAKPEL